MFLLTFIYVCFPPPPRVRPVAGPGLRPEGTKHATIIITIITIIIIIITILIITILIITTMITILIITTITIITTVIITILVPEPRSQPYVKTSSRPISP